MKKRGQLLTLWMLISIIGAVLVAYIFVEIATQRGSGEIFLKSRVARETALQVNTLYSVPGDAYIVNKGIYGFSLKVKDNEVRVFKGNTEGIIGTASYPFVNSGEQELEFTLINPQQVVISKINGKIKISDQVEEFFTNTERIILDDKSILIYFNAIDEHAGKIADIIELKHNNEKKLKNLIITHTIERIADSDVILSINSAEDNKFIVYLYKNSNYYPESRALAKSILDNLLGVIGQGELIELEQVNEGKKALDNNKISVYVEIPNTDKIEDTAKSIYYSLYT